MLKGPTDPTSRILPADSKYVCVDRYDEAEYWRRVFGVTRDELERAVEAVGHGHAAVSAFLQHV
ncbi:MULTISPECIES: DUF3606 domain-containing protein [Sphingobium]|uniref:DUF3606 domain-containing protein n=1 Tax=Sphingobium TaxID=165695 RepID=UPI001BE4F8F4|nr:MULTISPECIES: DUF3606 domain-containing protein [Sphingobium]MBT2245029.1 DUF3606 domain-containing protein [Sphingobium sp. BHU LFT2]WBQ19450.1 DUF3606 domain-containing protein [Sphingobium yanoikuyae]